MMGTFVGSLLTSGKARGAWVWRPRQGPWWSGLGGAGRGWAQGRDRLSMLGREVPSPAKDEGRGGEIQDNTR